MSKVGSLPPDQDSYFLSYHLVISFSLKSSCLFTCYHLFPFSLPAPLTCELLDEGPFLCFFRAVSQIQEALAESMNGALAVIRRTDQTVLQVWFCQGPIDTPLSKRVGEIAVLFVSILFLGLVSFVSGSPLTRRVREEGSSPQATLCPPPFRQFPACCHHLARTLTPGGQIFGRVWLLPPGQSLMRCFLKVGWGKGQSSCSVSPSCPAGLLPSVPPWAVKQSRRKPLLVSPSSLSHSPGASVQQLEQPHLFQESLHGHASSLPAEAERTQICC